MGGAKAIPIMSLYDGDGFREGLHPCYDLLHDGLFDGPTGKSPNFLSIPFHKNILVRFSPKSLHKPRRLVPLKGALAIVTDVGNEMRWMQAARLTSALSCGR